MEVVGVGDSGDPYVDSLVYGTRWNGTSLTYSFPTLASQYPDYPAGSETSNHFEGLNAAQQTAVQAALAAISSFSGLTFTQLTGGDIVSATLRFAMSDNPASAYAYLPTAEDFGGDAWFNNSKAYYDNPVPGNYGWYGFMHEIGHTIGLDHPHESDPPMPRDRDAMQFTVMSYSSTPYGQNGYTNSTFGFAQSYMMEDIAAVQFMYGANYSYNSTDTVYKWNSVTGEMSINGVGQGAPGANRIYMTVWDGGGNDTYDWSAYSASPGGLVIDLGPGSGTYQRNNSGGDLYKLNVNNALLFNNDSRSLIENAIGTPGKDVIRGNDAANILMGSPDGTQQIDGYEGADDIEGGGGDDRLIGGGLLYGGDGNDVLIGAGFGDSLEGGNGDDWVDGGKGDDRLYGGAGNDTLLGDEGNDMLRGDTGLNTLDGGAGNDMVEAGFGIGVLNGGTGNDWLTGSDGDDLLTDTSGDDRLEGYSGNDGMYFGADLTPADTVDGGPGIDSVAIQGNYPAGALSNFQNVEVLVLVSGANSSFGDQANNRYDYNITTNNGAIAAGQTLTIQGKDLLPGEDLVLNGAAETNGQLRVFAGQGNDSLTGGSVNDGFFFGADGNFTSVDRVYGKGGLDSLAFRGNYNGAQAVVFANDGMTGIDAIVTLSGHTREYGGPLAPGGFDYDLTTANGNVIAGQQMQVIASTLGADESLRFDGRAELDGSFRILAGASGDMLFGGAGNDILYGGLGADQLTGSGGGDTFLYRSTLESTSASRDTLVGFDAIDVIDLSFIDANGATPANDAFSFIGSAAFGNVAGQLRADIQAGNDWLVQADTDGNSTADFAILVQSIDAHPITQADFVV